MILAPNCVNRGDDLELLSWQKAAGQLLYIVTSTSHEDTTGSTERGVKSEHGLIE